MKPDVSVQDIKEIERAAGIRPRPEVVREGTCRCGRPWMVLKDHRGQLTAMHKKPACAAWAGVARKEMAGQGAIIPNRHQRRAQAAQARLAARRAPSEPPSAA